MDVYGNCVLIFLPVVKCLVNKGEQ